MQTQHSDIALGALLTGMGGGLALFLYGMRRMTEALRTVAGSGMKTVVARLTANRFSGLLAGALATAVLQSSSVTTVLIVGFITAGLMNFQQSIGVIIGSNIGTTVTAQIISFKVTQYALALIAVGFLLEVAARAERQRHYGKMLMGLGLLFFGMELMGDATRPLRAYEPFIAAMKELDQPLAAILAGTAFTALVQSSSATTGIVLVLAGQGFIPLETGIALLFGANIGTCTTALLSTLGKPREARRAAVIHVLFNLLGVALWLAFIPQFADLVRYLSATAPHLQGIERLAAETPRQIANAHTLFNVANAALFIGFVGPLAWAALRLVPHRSAPAPVSFLEEYYLESPALALDRVRMALGDLSARVRDMAEGSLQAAINGSRRQWDSIERSEQSVDALHGEIVTFLGRLSLKDLVDEQPATMQRYLSAANYLENVGDVVWDNMVSGAAQRQRDGLQVSPETQKVLEPLHRGAVESVAAATTALLNADAAAAAAVADTKKDFNRRREEAAAHLAQRLAADAPARLPLFRLENDLVDDLKRIHTLARRLSDLVEGQDAWRTPQTPPV